MDKLYKAYRGSASYAVQQKRGKNPYYVEGDETIVEYKGGVQNILDQIDAGLRSSMSYMAASNLDELKETWFICNKAQFRLILSNYIKEMPGN